MCNNIIRDFLAKTTVVFEVTVVSDYEATEINGTMSLKMVDSDGTTVLEKEADSYDDDVARFELSTSDTDLDAGSYDYEIIWTDVDFEYAWSGSLNVIERI